MIRFLAGCIASLALVSCGSPTSGNHWERTVCSESDQALIERGVEEAIPIVPYVDAALANRFTGDVPTYEKIVDRLIEVYSQGEVHCGAPLDEEEFSFSGLVYNEHRSILVNVDGQWWDRAREDWAASQEYGSLSAEEVESRIGGMDEDEYWTFRDTAETYLLGPAIATSVLTHESAHLVAPYCCSHGSDDSDRDCDFVDSVGTLAAHGVYWERWHQEGQWLDQLYWNSRAE